MDVLKKICNLFYKHCYCVILVSFFIAVSMSIILFSILKLDIDLYASYYTLSSIFQGLFSILALAGIFIIFKIDQLSKDNEKYDNDIENRLNKLYDIALKIRSLKNIPEYIFERLEYFLNIFEYSDKRYSLAQYLERHNILQDLENINEIMLDGYKTKNFSNEEFLKLIGHSKPIIHRIIEKQNLIDKNDLLKRELIELFKLPFISGMLLIALSIYFLALINYSPNLFHIPLSIIIMTAVISTIIVVFEIFYLIYYTMWSASAKNSLYHLKDYENHDR